MAIFTFHDPILSVAQAALHQVLSKAGHPASENLSTDHPNMRALVQRGHAFAGPRAQIPSGTDRDVDECLRLYVQYVEARVTCNHAKAEQLYEEIKFSACDPLWVDAIAHYEEFIHSGGKVEYTALQPGQGIGELPKTESGTVNVGLIADWGTGTAYAENVLAQTAALGPDLLVHLGDVYYAGTQDEAKANFLDGVRKIFPDAAFPVYNIPGNHDYYSGGAGFTWLRDQLGTQAASYFCLRNDRWQLVALDTGYNDRDPFTVESNTTLLTDDQAAWLKHVMETSGDRRTILLTHHQLYSGVGPVGESTVGGQPVRWGINPLLYEQVSPYFGQIPLWLWGHEHNTVIFEPQEGVPLGRCVGSGAIPIDVDANPYRQDPTLQGVNGIPVPRMDTRHELGNNGTDYNHGFATLALGPDEAVVTYYQVPPGGTAQVLCYDRVPHQAGAPLTSAADPAGAAVPA